MVFTVNEPWDHIPLHVLKEYYWRSYRIVQLKAPHWLTLLHDSFRLTPEFFGTFLKNCDNFAIDTHIYQAWAWENPALWFQQHACMDRTRLIEMESLGVPIIVGEWSLATDNCAMWLNGLNDNGKTQLVGFISYVSMSLLLCVLKSEYNMIINYLSLSIYIYTYCILYIIYCTFYIVLYMIVPGYPKVQCERVQCPAPYMGEQPGAPPDPTLPAQDPFGAGICTIV